MRVIVDFDRCEGHGVCTLAAPEVFSFDHRGSLQVVGRPGEEHRAAVEESIRTCPAIAIQLDAIQLDATQVGADATRQ